MSVRPRWISIFLSIFTLTYLNMVVSNIVTYRQREYSKYLLSKNTTLEPLQDILYTDWFPVHNIPYVDKIGLLVCVDVLTVLWSLGAIIVWGVNGQHLQHISEMLCAQMLLLPVFGLSQWFTVVPDSLPNCLAMNEVPEHGYDWVWYRVGRACGDMIWSSDMVQVIIFFKLYVQSVRKGCCFINKFCCNFLVRVIGIVFIALFISICLAARYQYSTDLFITMFVTGMVVTHRFVPKIARYFFIRKGYIQTYEGETESLNGDNSSI